MMNVISSGSAMMVNDGMTRLTSALKQNANRLANKSEQLKSETTALSNDVIGKVHEISNAAKTYSRSGAIMQSSHVVGGNLNETM